jgi:hypothetical protein
MTVAGVQRVLDHADVGCLGDHIPAAEKDSNAAEQSSRWLASTP